jgi:hypothetical protein
MQLGAPPPPRCSLRSRRSLGSLHSLREPRSGEHPSAAPKQAWDICLPRTLRDGEDCSATEKKTSALCLRCTLRSNGEHASAPNKPPSPRTPPPHPRTPRCSSRRRSRSRHEKSSPSNYSFDGRTRRWTSRTHGAPQSLPSRSRSRWRRGGSAPSHGRPRARLSALRACRPSSRWRSRSFRFFELPP